MEKQRAQHQQKLTPVSAKSYFKPMMADFEAESCQYCTYSMQDIDTFPCAKCHTRH